jgi:NACHT domain
MPLTSSSIIQEVKEKCDTGLALMGYYYFDFRDTAKQDIRGLLASLLAQLCAESDSCHDLLSGLYHLKKNAQPEICLLVECLKKMLQLPRRPMIYIIMDALDECPNSSGLGFQKTAREKVLGVLGELLDLNLPNLRICVTSRPEVDIRDTLERRASHHMSLHDESGQKNDILDYISSIVLTDRNMRKWRSADKQLVIDTLSAKADGM